MQTSFTGNLLLTRPWTLESTNRYFSLSTARDIFWITNQVGRAMANSPKLLIVSALCLLFAVTMPAQTSTTSSSTSRGAALDQAMDRLEIRGERNVANPVLSLLAVNISVNCNLPVSPFGSITAALRILNPRAINIVHVSGACHENVTVQSFENLSLIANPGASINDASAGNLDVLDVADTQEFSIQGFTINGGSTGVACFQYSLCRFSGNTIQGSAGDGVVVRTAHATFQGDTLQNNGGRGLAVINAGLAVASGVTLQGNVAAGAIANVDGRIIGANLTSRNNGAAGIRISSHSTLRLIDSTLTGNGGSGVALDSSSEARFDTNTTGNTITGNTANGVALSDLSFALFAGTDNITLNNLGNPGGIDVNCRPQFSATRGALTSIGGGTTNCVEP